MKRTRTDRRAAQDGVRVHPALQKGEGEPGPEVGQDALEGRRGPANQVEQAALGAGDRVLDAAALLGEPLQGMAPGHGDVDGVEPRAAEDRNGGEDMRVGEIGLGVLGEIAAQSALTRLPLTRATATPASASR